MLQVRAEIEAGTFVGREMNIDVQNTLAALQHKFSSLQVFDQSKSSMQIKGDPDVMYTILYNTVRNAMCHGATSQPITALIRSEAQALVISIRNIPGPKHLECQKHFGKELVRLDSVSKIAIKANLGSEDSTFRGCTDIHKLALYLGADVSLQFADEFVQLILTIEAISSSEVADPLIPAEINLEEVQGSDKINLVLIDDQHACRLPALKYALALNVPTASYKWAPQEINTSDSYRNGPNLYVWGRDVQDVSEEKFRSIDAAVRARPTIIMLDENLDFHNGCIKGSDLCRQIREWGWKCIVLIRSANDGACDNDRYQAAKADGVFSKTMCVSEAGEELSRWKVAAFAAFNSGLIAL